MYRLLIIQRFKCLKINFMQYSAFVLFLFFCTPVSSDITDIFVYSEPSACEENEYFNTNSFKCTPCDASKFLIPSTDKLYCTCNAQSVIVSWNKNGFPDCKNCSEGQRPSKDRRFCIDCPESQGVGSNRTCNCPRNTIEVYTMPNGSRNTRLECVKCLEGTRPSTFQCVPCSLSAPNCSCPFKTHETLANGECVDKASLSSWSSRPAEMYKIEYESVTAESSYLRNNLLSTGYWCKMKKSISCQSLANMCVLSMYQDDYRGGPCRMLKDMFKSMPVNEEHSPWIYYPEGEAQNVANNKSIGEVYGIDKHSKQSYLDIVLSKWSPNGSWIGFESGLQRLIPCSTGSSNLLRFTIEYKKECFFKVQDVFNKVSAVFYDVYLRYSVKNQTKLQSVPVLNLNYRLRKKFPNKLSDVNQWQLTRRIFNFEGNVNASKHSTQIYRFLQSITLRVRIRPDGKVGTIYTPILVVSYGEITSEDLDPNKNLRFTFRVEYESKQNLKRNVDIALGVLCSVSVLWSLVRAWAVTRRSGQRPIDLVAVLHLCITSCGHLSNVFFFVISSTAIHAFVYYKWQAVPHALLPTPKLLYLVRTYVIVAFPLKILEVIVMMWQHLTMDIFMIDWEQPKVDEKHTVFSVSAWRTYFVANKWNEIQTIRKTSVLLQLCLVIFILKVLRLETWTHREPDLTPSLPIGEAEEDKVFRLAMALLVYIVIYITQWIVLGCVYERYVKNPIHEFVDICSLANISVFILSQENFGYYVHGRSAHGFSDTDMATLRRHLRREEEDLVGHRGLVAASDQQTFQILIPPKLRQIYQSLLNNIPYDSFIALRKKHAKNETRSDSIMLTYVTINRFLAAFIGHALKDLDYEVREKLFVESLLDIELFDYSQKGVFYNDNGHSFDNVLYYGNEMTLFTFDLILFSFIEILFQNYLLAAILTLIFDEGLARIRRYGSKKNLAKKALIDEYFLL